VVEEADGVDLVAEEFDADGARGTGWPAVEDSAAQGGFALGVDLHAKFIPRVGHPAGQFFKAVFFTDGERAHGLFRLSGHWNVLLQRLRAGDDDEGVFFGEALDDPQVLAKDRGILFHGLEEQRSAGSRRYGIAGFQPALQSADRFVEAFHFAGIGGDPENREFQDLENTEAVEGLRSDGRVGHLCSSRRNAFKHRLVYMKGAASIQINCHGWNCSG
ncbi:MAG: hypothetical protein DRQ89_13750, partial [Epsilonproteobacteria bacterium]